MMLLLYDASLVLHCTLITSTNSGTRYHWWAIKAQKRMVDNTDEEQVELHPQEDDGSLEAEKKGEAAPKETQSLDEAKNEEAAPERTLIENTYSIIFVAPLASLAFVFGLIFFVFQAALATLVLLNLIDFDKDGFFEKLQVPEDVRSEVAVAAYLSQALAIPLFQDLVTSIERFHEGYHPAAMEQNPHATRGKWLFSCFLEMLSGALFQFAIFILIVQATSVVGMLLNFAGMFQ